jgi:hypothetical protein
MADPCNPGYCICCGCVNNLDCVTDWRYSCNGVLKGPFANECECAQAVIADSCGQPFPICFAGSLDFECCPDGTCAPEGNCPP